MSKFGYIMKTSVVTLALAAFGLAPATQALADQRYNNHHDRHYYNNGGYYGHYYGHSYNRHHYNRHHGHGGDVAFGILAGGLLFYALTANQRSNSTRSYDRRVYVRQQPVYVQPPQQQWTYRVPAQPQRQNTDRSCLQVREYQTTITVGGQNVPAYGQSCLQPDGSWKLGPAIPEPGY